MWTDSSVWTEGTGRRKFGEELERTFLRETRWRQRGGVRTSRSGALTAFVCPLEPRTQDRQRDADGEDGGEGASEHSSCQEHQEAANQEEAPRWTVPGWCFSGARPSRRRGERHLQGGVRRHTISSKWP